jgi:hypothetical protein
MGTGSSKFSGDTLDIKFVGRDDELKRVGLLLNQQKTLRLHGMKQIGKSRFLAELYRSERDSGTLCIFKDLKWIIRYHHANIINGSVICLLYLAVIKD